MSYFNFPSLTASLTYPLSADDGTVSLPSYSFTNDLDCGLYRIGANNLGLAVNGAKVLDVSTAGLGVTGTLIVTGATTLATTLTGVVKAASGVLSAATVLNVDVNAAAAIDFSKLATLASANILVGSAGGVATSTAVTGDVTISNTGVTAIGATKVTNGMLAGSIAYSKLTLTDSILNADINSAAAIAGTKISPDFGAQNIVTTGKITTSGVTDASSAAAGKVGEVISSRITSPVSAPTSGQFGDLTSISLTAGRWDVSLNAEGLLNTGVAILAMGLGIGTATGNSSTGTISGVNFHNGPPATANYNAAITIASFEVNISGTTTYYAKTYAEYTSGTPQFRGEISAKRVR